MRNNKKTAPKLLVLTLALATLLSACGGNNNAANNTDSSNTGTNTGAAGNATSGDTSKEVKIKMLLVGGKPVDYDEVFGKLNTILKEKINATVEAEFLDWSDYLQKYPLKFAANEDFDIAYTSNWAFYNDQALKGGFLEITDEMVEKYLPQMLKAQSEAAWGQAKIGGKLFMVPQNSNEVVDKTVLVREDLRKKYNLEPVTSPETYAAYLKGVAANEKGMSAYGAKPADGWKWHELDEIMLIQQNQWKVVDPDAPLVFDKDDATGKIFNVYETPEFKETLQYYKDLADSGAWSKNIVSNKNDVWQDIKAGKVSSYAHNLGTVALNLAEARRDTPDVEMGIADLTPDKHKGAAISTQNGLAIHATSKNVERSLMLIDLLQNDKEIYDLTMYGVEGKHYVAVGDDKMEPGPNAASYTGFSNWGWNSPLKRTDTSYPKEADAISAGWQEHVYHFPLETFVFDDTKVKNQVANVGNVMLRYAIPLEYGLIADLDKGQTDLIKQLKAAGIDKVQEEMQLQVDAFLAEQAK